MSETESAIWNIFSHNEYQEVVRMALGHDRSGAKRSGMAKKLADHMKCHPTFVSQVVKGKANFNNDQAMAFCQFFELDGPETEFFLNLVNLDRSATPAARKHYVELLDRQRKERRDLGKRLGLKSNLTAEQQTWYYESWVPQAVHILCQVPGKNHVDDLARALGLSKPKLVEVVKKLAQIGIVEIADNRVHSVVDTIHLSKESPLRGKFLTNWRQKVIQDINEFERDKGIHYSAVVSLSEEDASKLQEIMLDHLKVIRDKVVDSESRTVFVHNLDFYPILRDVAGSRK